MCCFLIVCELHLNLVLELDLYLGYVIINFSQFFLEAMVSKIGRNFCYDVNLYISKTS